MEFGKILDRLGDFHSLAVDLVGCCGGLALLWRKDVVVDLLYIVVCALY